MVAGVLVLCFLVDLVFALFEFVVIVGRGFVLFVCLCDSGYLIADLRVVACWFIVI